MKIQLITALLLAAGVLAQGIAKPPEKSTVKNDNAEVFYHLGLNYYHGLGDKPDYAQALENFQKAAALGLAKAQGMIGQCHLRGRGVPRNARQAAAWLVKAATGGDKIAQFARKAGGRPAVHRGQCGRAGLSRGRGGAAAAADFLDNARGVPALFQGMEKTSRV